MTENTNAERPQVEPSSTKPSAEGTQPRESKYRLTSGGTKIHPTILQQIESRYMLTKESEDAFYEVVTAVIDDFNAITFSLQEWALKRAITIWEWWYFDQARIDIVAAEMQPAAIDVFKQFLDPTGRQGPLVEDKAVKLAEENFHGETLYEQRDLEVGGLGNYPIDAEAFRRALPALAPSRS